MNNTKSLWFNIRNYIIRLLAGNSTVILNAKIALGETLHPVGDWFIADSTFYRNDESVDKDELIEALTKHKDLFTEKGKRKCEIEGCHKKAMGFVDGEEWEFSGRVCEIHGDVV